MARGEIAAAAAVKKVARSGALSLVRLCFECESLLSRNCNSASAASSGSLSASGSIAGNDSSSTLISLRASAQHFSKATPPPFSSSSSSFPAAASAVANGSGSVNTFFGGTFNPGKSQNSKSVILQRLVGRSLSSSASSESPPPPPPLPPPAPRYHRENPPDANNPDPVTLQEQWRYATRMYSMWYAHAWGTAILAGLSFYGLGWFIKGGNPLQFGSSDKKEEVLLKPE